MAFFSPSSDCTFLSADSSPSSLNAISRLHAAPTHRTTVSGFSRSTWRPGNYSIKKGVKAVSASLSFEESAMRGDDYLCSGTASAKQVKAKELQQAFNRHQDTTEKVGVLLLNLGGPESLTDVQPFLYNLFADPDIVRLPRLLKGFQQPLAKLISFLRAPRSKASYAAIGGGSPLRKITEDQANALNQALRGKNIPANVYIAMRYWHPFTEDAINQIKMDQITKLVVLPLYPHFSISTSGSSLRILEEMFRNDEYLTSMQHAVIPSWYHREGYLKSMAKLISDELEMFEQQNEVVIFFSAHGVPRNYVDEAGDPYKDEMEECVRLMVNELRKNGIHNNHALAYQSRVGPIEWLKPYTDETIKELGQKGVKRLLTVPISFVSEHIETLEEIDVEYKNLAMDSGIIEWGRVPALGCEEAFISDLADAVIEALEDMRDLDVRANDDSSLWTISKTLEDYFLPYGGRAWMEWLS